MTIDEEATPDVEMVQRMVEYLERIQSERYPPQIFLPLTDKQWHSLKLWCESEGFPLDRLSGNYGRELRAADMAIATEALTEAQAWLERQGKCGEGEV